MRRGARKLPATPGRLPPFCPTLPLPPFSGGGASASLPRRLFSPLVPLSNGPFPAGRPQCVPPRVYHRARGGGEGASRAALACWGEGASHPGSPLRAPASYLGRGEGAVPGGARRPSTRAARRVKSPSTCLAKTAMSSLKESEEQTSPPATPGSRGVQVASSHFSKTSASRGNSGCLPGGGTQRQKRGHVERSARQQVPSRPGPLRAPRGTWPRSPRLTRLGLSAGWGWAGGPRTEREAAPSAPRRPAGRPASRTRAPRGGRALAQAAGTAAGLTPSSSLTGGTSPGVPGRRRGLRAGARSAGWRAEEGGSGTPGGGPRVAPTHLPRRARAGEARPMPGGSLSSAHCPSRLWKPERASERGRPGRGRRNVPARRPLVPPRARLSPDNERPRSRLRELSGSATPPPKVWATERVPPALAQQLPGCGGLCGGRRQQRRPSPHSAVARPKGDLFARGSPWLVPSKKTGLSPAIPEPGASFQASVLRGAGLPPPQSKFGALEGRGPSRGSGPGAWGARARCSSGGGSLSSPRPLGILPGLRPRSLRRISRQQRAAFSELGPPECGRGRMARVGPDPGSCPRAPRILSPGRGRASPRRSPPGESLPALRPSRPRRAHPRRGEGRGARRACLVPTRRSRPCPASGRR